MASFSLKQLAQLAHSLGVRCLLAGLVYGIRQRWYELQAGVFPRSTAVKMARRHRSGARTGERSASADEALDDVLSYRAGLDHGQAIDLVCRNGVLRLEVLASDLIRLRLCPPGPSSPGPDDFSPPFSYALDHDAEWPPALFDVEENDEALTIRTNRLICRVTKSPCRLAFLDDQGRPLSEASAGLGFRGAGVFCTRRLVEGEAIYGLGEKAFGLNLRGRKPEMWNTDPHTYSPGDDPIHLNIPMLVGLREGRAYGFFFDNPGRARFDLGQARPDQLRYEADTAKSRSAAGRAESRSIAEWGELCAYFFAGPTIPAVLERYTQLTGRMPLPPRWMLGYHQSRWSYYPEQQVRELVAGFRRRRIPCDVIHLDIHYMDGYRIFTWDPDRFPDPSHLLADLRESGFRAICIIDPGVKVDPGYHVHDQGLARDVFCRLPDARDRRGGVSPPKGSTPSRTGAESRDLSAGPSVSRPAVGADAPLFRGPVWPGECYFPDFTDPEVRAWWGDLYHPLLEAGVAGFWNDMNEPAIFGGEMPHNVLHSYEGRGANHGQIHNAYGLQMARATAEGLRRLRPDERIPVISRAGYAGLQRYALVWTGDNQSTWAQLRLGVSVCLNLGLSGVAFCGPDVGGFSFDCEGELLTRWTQVGALTPFFRNHSALGTKNQEPWAFGEPYETICRRWIELRYELLPYIYTAAWQASQTGLPMMRPLSLAFPKEIRTYSLDDQFLLGDALLAAPIVHPGQRSRQVYLPGGARGRDYAQQQEGLWYDFWTGERLSGEVTVDAPLERMPLFVRAGTVLPMGPVLQHSGEWPPEALHLHIYPGDGESWLYEDDGHSLAYRSGEFRLTRFVCKSSHKGLTVRREAEGPFDPGYERFEIQIHGLNRAPDQVLVDGRPVDAAFDPNTQTARLAVGPWSHLAMGQ